MEKIYLKVVSFWEMEFARNYQTGKESWNIDALYHIQTDGPICRCLSLETVGKTSAVKETLSLLDIVQYCYDVGLSFFLAR